MHRIDLENLSQKVADSIAERIIRGELETGERLVEAKIARELGVSQGTIREAFRILEKKKMVSILPRRGTTVTQLNADYVDALYDILAELYILMIKKAKLKMKPADIEDLSLAMKSMEKYAKAEDDQRFHDALFDALKIFLRVANDPLLEPIIMDLWQVTRWVQYKTILYKKKAHQDNYYELDVLDMAIRGTFNNVARKIRRETQNTKMIAIKGLQSKSA
jgi:DNA-binding GntR family transcriptional regulator